MSRARAEQTSTGNALLVMVGLGMLFLLFTAFLGVMKTHSGPIYGESNMLYTALIFYAGASALYMGFGVTGIERYVKFASLSTALGFARQYGGCALTAGTWPGIPRFRRSMRCCSASSGRWPR